jgi:hypothetical protein
MKEGKKVHKTVCLQVEVLRGGSKIVRPAEALGTCGWHPKAWTLAVMKKRDTPQSAFLRVNPNWTEGDVV